MRIRLESAQQFQWQGTEREELCSYATPKIFGPA